MATITISYPEDIFRKNPEAYQEVDLTVAYMILCMHAVPDSRLYKSIDEEIRKSATDLQKQIDADGLEHVRIRIGDKEGKFFEVLQNDAERRRIMGFYLVIMRTKEGWHTEDLLEQYGFKHRAELVHAIPELYTDDAEPRLRHKKRVPIRTLLKEIVEVNKKRIGK